MGGIKFFPKISFPNPVINDVEIFLKIVLPRFGMVFSLFWKKKRIGFSDGGVLQRVFVLRWINID